MEWDRGSEGVRRKKGGEGVMRKVWSSRRGWIMSDKSKASETVVVLVVRILAELEVILSERG